MEEDGLVCTVQKKEVHILIPKYCLNNYCDKRMEDVRRGIGEFKRR